MDYLFKAGFGDVYIDFNLSAVEINCPVVQMSVYTLCSPGQTVLISTWRVVHNCRHEIAGCTE